MKHRKLEKCLKNFSFGQSENIKKSTSECNITNPFLIKDEFSLKKFNLLILGSENDMD